MSKAEEKIHELKTWNPYFNDVLMGHKNFELRKNDRDFKVGDKVILQEYDPVINDYSGRELTRTITYVLKGFQAREFGLEEGYVILSLA